MVQTVDERNQCGTSEGQNEIVSLDDVFEVLTSPQRRAILYVLCQYPNPMNVSELGKRVATANCSGGDVVCREQLVTTLHHVHLPKLEQFSLVNYDRETNIVEPNPLPRRLKRCLRFAAEDEMRENVEDATA
ncbi:DUF7344 domain-containing protein [Haladaptatus caseinilyticus]|uniref:DUF7344 domain-containing protein n=1 Tax=Haladaptatus caseinilyticus TaxID=2993314 RepID=UPI00224A8DE6|nr:hypothetical protein [Haladaptatus caseinilyticus]